MANELVIMMSQCIIINIILPTKAGVLVLNSNTNELKIVMLTDKFFLSESRCGCILALYTYDTHLENSDINSSLPLSL